MPTCAFLTLDDPSPYVIDDELAIAPLQALGWQVELVSWRRPAAWRDYDAVVIRSTYDYTEAPDHFLAVLETIEHSGTSLFNGVQTVRWNLRKTYLRDLANRGVPVVPTVWRDRLRPGELPELLRATGADQAVVKPVVGASAGGAYRLDARTLRDRTDEIEAWYADRALMAQPFIPTIVTEGEFSLFYFNGEHSHTILKTPREGDFRVQEEHGGLIRPVRAQAGLLAAARTVLAAIGPVPLYVRADFVRAGDGERFWLMELELIEPSLYLRTDPGAPQRFARAIHQRVHASRAGPERI
jgi:glutathione synthase/RimK-type ligase-like ATP-grasp enzyme